MNELQWRSSGRCPERAVEAAFGELCEIGKFGNPYRRAQMRVDEVDDAPQPQCRQFNRRILHFRTTVSASKVQNER